MGLRQFGAAERYLQLVEDESSRRRVGSHVLNARILRCRMALHTGELDRACELIQAPANEVTIPSLQGEFLATQAVTYAALGDRPQAITQATAAVERSTAVEVRVLAMAARAIAAAASDQGEDCKALFACAASLGTWDPVVTALRCSALLRETAARDQTLRSELAKLYEHSNDLALARRAGIRARSHRAPEELLTPRECEVLGLLARGFRNRDIAHALVISESTTKVHVRHILEKLGVRTRAEAITASTFSQARPIASALSADSAASSVSAA